MAEPRALEAAGWQHSCPQCGYENGFHVSFRRDAAASGDGEVAVWLICPSCSALFDIGLRTRLHPVPKA